MHRLFSRGPAAVIGFLCTTRTNRQDMCETSAAVREAPAYGTVPLFHFRLPRIGSSGQAG